MMKILCLHQGFELYGSDRSFLLSLEIIKAKNPESHLTVIIPRNGPLVDELSKIADTLLIQDIGSISRSDLISPFKTLGRIFSKTREAIRLCRQYDLIYVNTVVVISYILALRFLDAPGIVHVREIPGKLESLIFSTILRFSKAHVIYNSDNTRRSFYFRNESRSKVILNAVKGFRGPDLREPTPTKILMIGRINGWKGQILLLKAVAGIAEGLKKNIRVRFVGEAPVGKDAYVKELRELIVNHSLDGIVEIYPFALNPQEHYLWANMVVVPSTKPEPFGRVAIEGMSVGLPVLAAQHGGLIEIIEDGYNGWFFEPGNISSLKNKLSIILSKPEEIIIIGKHAKLTFNQRFTVPIYEQSFMEFFNSVLK